MSLWFAWKIVLLQYHKHHLVAISLAWSVVICLKNRTFAVSQTSKTKDKLQASRCDLLEKSYFCSITNIKSWKKSFAELVVICLKNRTFAVSQTSDALITSTEFKLWFAWKIVLLQYHKHLTEKLSSSIHSCDLLEKSYFCSITNIRKSKDILVSPVVICLKNRTFAVSQTSGNPKTSLSVRLWFAWKIVLLQYHKHLDEGLQLTATVVICLKNRTFAVSQTSGHRLAHSVHLLWFAWKIVLLQYHKHPFNQRILATSCCDLLEKSYFCSITNIRPPRRLSTTPVVICLKNRTFAVSQTSVIEGGESEPGCDLLEKSYFCSITNIR